MSELARDRVTETRYATHGHLGALARIHRLARRIEATLGSGFDHVDHEKLLAVVRFREHAEPGSMSSLRYEPQASRPCVSMASIFGVASGPLDVVCPQQKSASMQAIGT
ncbi:MAG: hypothetical protein ACI8W3_001736 [Myxococcota bacterium]|jgi:hypothetical protein